MDSVSRKIYVGLVLFCVSIFSQVFPVSKGSESAVSIQANFTFPASDSDNRIKAFGFFKNGFSLQDYTTSCTFESVFPVEGNVDLDGGTLYLNEDLVFRDHARLIDGGTFDGQGEYAIEFPYCPPLFSFPTYSFCDEFNILDTVTLTSSVISLDWSHDNKYVAVGSAYTGSNPYELTIYSFNGAILTKKATKNLGSSINSVRWHPTEYYLAIGGLSDNYEFEIYDFNSSTNVLTRIDYDDYFDSSSVNAVSWHPSGEHLVVGENLNSGNEAIKLYSFDTSSAPNYLTLEQNVSLSPGNEVKWDAFSWAPGGNFLAVGCDKDAESNEIKIYSFNGSALAYSTGVELDADDLIVDWSPTGTYIVSGKNDGTERLRIFAHNVQAGTLTEVLSARVGYSSTVYEAFWNSIGDSIVIASDDKYAVFNFDKNTETLSECFTKYVDYAYGVRWSHDDKYAVVGYKENISRAEADSCTSYYDKKVDVFGVGVRDYPLEFKNTCVAMHSDISPKGQWWFRGDCTLQGHGNSLDLNNTSSIYVKSGSTLDIVDTVITGIGHSGFVFGDEDSRLRFSNVRLQLDHDYTLTQGGIYIDDGGAVFVTGDNIFTFDQQGSLTLDQVTLWYDTLGTPDNNNVRFGPPVSRAIENIYGSNLTILHGGGIRPYCCDLVRNNSNVIVNLTTQVSELAINNSNVIVSWKDDIRTTSNAFLYCCKNTSNALINCCRTTSHALNYHIKNNSSAIINLKEHGTDLARHNSHALRYGIKNNSNAIVSLKNTGCELSHNNSNALLYCCKNTSHALNYHIRNNSSAIINLKFEGTELSKQNSHALRYGIKNNSNAIVNLKFGGCDLAHENSNTILHCCRNTSNAIINLDNRVTINEGDINTNETNIDINAQWITNNSNAIINIKQHGTELARANSNAILYCCKNTRHALGYGIRNNSNAIVRMNFGGCDLAHENSNTRSE